MDPARKVKEACRNVCLGRCAFFAYTSIYIIHLSLCIFEPGPLKSSNAYVVYSLLLRQYNARSLPSLLETAKPSNFLLYHVTFIYWPAQSIKDSEWSRSIIAALRLTSMNTPRLSSLLLPGTDVCFLCLFHNTDFLPRRSNTNSEMCVSTLNSTPNFLNPKYGIERCSDLTYARSAVLSPTSPILCPK